METGGGIQAWDFLRRVADYRAARRPAGRARRSRGPGSRGGFPGAGPDAESDRRQAILADPRDLHRELFASFTPAGYPECAGTYRGTPDTSLADIRMSAPSQIDPDVVYEFCPPREVPWLMTELRLNTRSLLYAPDQEDYDKLTTLAYTFCRFGRIHPFLDGNGHVQRAHGSHAGPENSRHEDGSGKTQALQNATLWLYCTARRSAPSHSEAAPAVARRFCHNRAGPFLVCFTRQTTAATRHGKTLVSHCQPPSRAIHQPLNGGKIACASNERMRETTPASDATQKNTSD